MAAEGSTAATSVRSGGGGASADSYIGSVISLTSKSEIRYEGILYNINTEESSIGLRSVRSFGTEGRNKDGPQVPPSNKIYEYILFRGSDIKDLQVKASPLVQTTPPIHNDPAIIQSHYPRPPAPTASIPAAAAAATLPDHVSLSSQMGLPGSTFQNNLHLYQPGGTLNSWGHSLPNPNGSGLAMPMYWQGFYGTPNGLPQQSLLRPPPGMSVPPSMQQIQFSAPFSSTLPTASSSLLSSTLPDYQSSVVSNSMGSSSSTPSTFLTSPALSLNVPPVQPMSLVSEILSNPLQNKAPAVSPSGISASTPSSSLPSLAQLPTSIPDNALLQSVASKPSLIPGSSAMAQQSISQPGLSTFSQASGSVLTEKQTLPLVTPGQLLQSAASVVSAPQTPQTVQKDVEVVQVSSKPLPEASVPVAKEAQPPILPLPANTRAQKHNGGVYHMRNNYRGRGGRGYGISRPVAKFTEDFDFTAMNEKFNKDEVWGHLGKSNRSQSNDKEENESDEEDDSQIEDDAELPKIEIKPVYNKDDFFDSLSCNSLESDPNNGRTRYSEQMKLDTETFGEFSRYRGRGGRGPGRGGGRFRGSYNGRGYGGYGGRGRGRGIHGRSY